MMPRGRDAKTDFRRILAAWTAAFFGVAGGPSAHAAKPDLEHVYPPAVARGTTNNVTLSGKFDPWPPKAWMSSGVVEFSFSTNKGKATVVVAPDADPGPKLFRLFNDEGASEPAIFVVSDQPPVPDTEPNDHFRKAQTLTNFPAEISGRLEKNNDVDCFAFDVKAGQWLDVRMDSHVLMSKVDGVLRLVTTNGHQLAWNHDFASMDPRLVWQAPQDMTVVLQVFGFVYPANAEIRLTGGNGGIYLLHMTVCDRAPADLTVALCEEKAGGTFPLEVFGAICPAGDEDVYPVELKKDEFIKLSVDASTYGSPLDPWVVIRNGEGKELARNDDAEGSRNASLEWKAPADGKYSIAVGSVTHQGREDWRYALRAMNVGPDFDATFAASSVVIEPSATNDVKVAVKRLRGFTNEITATIEGLPEGVAAEPAKSSGNGSEIVLKLVSTDAPVFNGPVRIALEDKTDSKSKTATFELVSRGENNGVPQGYSKLLIERTDQLWLTVKPKPASK